MFYETERRGVRKKYLPLQCCQVRLPAPGPIGGRGRALLCSCRATYCSAEPQTHSPCRILQQEPPAASLSQAHTLIKHTVSAQMLLPTPLAETPVTPVQENTNKSFSFLLSAKLCRKAKEPGITMRHLAQQPQNLTN